eukprot:gene11248-7816_t
MPYKEVLFQVHFTDRICWEADSPPAGSVCSTVREVRMRAKDSGRRTSTYKHPKAAVRPYALYVRWRASLPMARPLLLYWPFVMQAVPCKAKLMLSREPLLMLCIFESAPKTAADAQDCSKAALFFAIRRCLAASQRFRDGMKFRLIHCNLSLWVNHENDRCTGATGLKVCTTYLSIHIQFFLRKWKLFKTTFKNCCGKIDLDIKNYRWGYVGP